MMTVWKLPDHLTILVVTQTNSTRTAFICPAAWPHIMSTLRQSAAVGIYGIYVYTQWNYQLHQEMAGHVHKHQCRSPTLSVRDNSNGVCGTEGSLRLLGPEHLNTLLTKNEQLKTGTQPLRHPYCLEPSCIMIEYTLTVSSLTAAKIDAGRRSRQSRAGLSLPRAFVQQG